MPLPQRSIMTAVPRRVVFMCSAARTVGHCRTNTLNVHISSDVDGIDQQISAAFIGSGRNLGRFNGLVANFSLLAVIAEFFLFGSLFSKSMPGLRWRALAHEMLPELGVVRGGKKTTRGR